MTVLIEIPSFFAILASISVIFVAAIKTFSPMYRGYTPRQLMIGIYIFMVILFANSIHSRNITLGKIPLLEQLPVNAIHRIYQDSEGYMWYGTINGLCRDDGYNVKIFRSDLENPELLASSDITAITEDKDNKIWFGTFRGAYILDKQTDEIHPLKDPRLRGKRIAEIKSTTDGSIWVSISGLLLRYDSNENLLNEYSLLFANTPRELQYMVEDRAGNILFSMGENTLYKVDDEKQSLRPFAVMPHSINHFIQDQTKSYYWVGTWGSGIIRFDPAAPSDSRFIPQPLPINSKNETDGHIIRIVQDDIFGYLWVATYSDLVVFEITEEGMLKQIDTSDFLPQHNKMLSEMIKDREGNLWMAGYNVESSIISFQDNTVKGFPITPLRQYLGGNPAITSLCKDEDGIFWLAQDRVGLCLYAPEENHISYYFEFPETQHLWLNHISQIEKSQKHNKVWVAPFGPEVYGLVRESRKLKHTHHIRLSDVNPHPGNVESLYEDSRHNLWIGTTNSLYIYRPNQNKPEQINSITNIVSEIVETTDGTIWIATERDGIYKIDGNETPVKFSIGKELLCFNATPDGKFWLGTGEGNVLLFDPLTSAITDYSIACGMNGDRVYKIIVDIYNHVWIYTNQKLTEFNPINGSYRNFLASDEWLLLNRFLPRAIYKDPSGTIYFGGIPGFIALQPSHHLESMPQQVHTTITDVEVMGSPFPFASKPAKDMPGKVEFSAKDRNIAIHFSSLDHGNARKIRYAYRMKGIDKDWVYIGDGRNTAFYNQLKKGKYTFEVKATDENGLWSNNITTLAVVRHPAFYETWWAYTLYILLAAAIAWSFLSLYIRRLKLKNEKDLVEEVTQMKLRYFTNISHDLMTPLTIISCVADELQTEEPESEKKIGLLKSNIMRLKRLLQQVLDFRKVENNRMELHVSRNELVDFVQNIYDQSFSPLAETKNIDFSFSTSVDTLEVWFDTDKLDKILFNLLSNAFKYTPANKKVWLHIETVETYGRTYARIQVGDEGVGISPKEQEKIFTRFYNNKFSEARQSNGIGLSLAKELIELHHGKIFLESELGKGSVFTIEFPVDRESYEATEIAEKQIVVQSLTATEEPTEKTDYTLLLVEDNEELLGLIAGFFSKKYHVYTAENGLEALERIKNHKIDIIVSDIMMPEMDGLELCRTIKNNVETSHILILLLTAKTQTEDRISSYDAGADAYISKPFELPVIQARLNNLLRHKLKLQKEFRKNPDVKISQLEFTSLDEQLLQKAIGFVEENIADPTFGVEQLMDKMAMSHSTLSRKMKTLCGLTPLDFIRNIRLKHAARLLKNPNITVAEAAMQLGFNDRRYFSQCFKEEYGMTPSEYQKNE